MSHTLYILCKSLSFNGQFLQNYLVYWTQIFKDFILLPVALLDNDKHMLIRQKM